MKTSQRENTRPHEDFLGFQSDAIHLYEQGELEQAMALIKKNASRFPDQAVQTENWRICILSLQGKTDQALATMEDALRSGLWWSPEMLLEDPDLDALKGEPAFARLVERCAVRQAQALSAGAPQPLILSPQDNPPAPFPWLLVMHGRHSNAAFNAPYWSPVIHQGWLLAMAQSRQHVDSSNATWDDTERAIQDVRRQAERVMETHPADTDRLVLAGFSQGAGLAIRMSLSRALPARGWIAVAPYLPDVDWLVDHLESREGAPARGYIILGEQDPLGQSFSQINDVLRQGGVEVEVERHADLGHMYPQDFTASLRRGLDFIL